MLAAAVVMASMTSCTVAAAAGSITSTVLPSVSVIWKSGRLPPSLRTPSPLLRLERGVEVSRSIAIWSLRRTPVPGLSTASATPPPPSSATPPPRPLPAMTPAMPSVSRPRSAASDDIDEHFSSETPA